MIFLDVEIEEMTHCEAVLILNLCINKASLGSIADFQKENREEMTKGNNPSLKNTLENNTNQISCIFSYIFTHHDAIMNW